MIFVLKYIPTNLEDWFRAWINEKYGKRKGAEKSAFTEMILFFKDNQEFYEKWKKDKEIQGILKKDLME